MHARTRSRGWRRRIAGATLLPLCLLLLAACGDEGAAVAADPAKVSEARGHCLTWYHLAKAWRRGTGKVPTTVAGLVPASEDGKPAMTQLDPWGHVYEVYLDAGTLRVRSRGPDGQPATQDDIIHPLPD